MRLVKIECKRGGQMPIVNWECKPIDVSSTYCTVCSVHHIVFVFTYFIGEGAVVLPLKHLQRAFLSLSCAGAGKANAAFRYLAVPHETGTPPRRCKTLHDAHDGKNDRPDREHHQHQQQGRLCWQQRSRRRERRWRRRGRWLRRR